MWDRIRNVGELQILTRASYFILVFVPILAGLWPAVRVGINRYNQAVTDSRIALDAASERLEYIASTLDQQSDISTRAVEIIEALDIKVDLIVADYSLKAIEQVGLPMVWALAFLASLAVTAAHVLYQTRAPSLIQQVKLREHVDAELRRFLEYRSEGQLNRARTLVRDYGSRNVVGYDIPDMQQVTHTQEDVGTSIADLPIPREEAVLIENGAIIEYRDAANQNPWMATACSVLYFTGLLLIVWIIVTQTNNVISATAWN